MSDPLAEGHSLLFASGHQNTPGFSNALSGRRPTKTQAYAM